MCPENIITLLTEYYKKKLLEKKILHNKCTIKTKSVKRTEKRNQSLIQSYLNIIERSTSPSTSQSFSTAGEEIMETDLLSLLRSSLFDFEKLLETILLEENTTVRKVIISGAKQGK